MFIKFLDHDLRYGIGHAKKRLIVTFIMFANCKFKLDTQR